MIGDGRTASAEGLGQVGPEVLDVLDADREAQQGGRGAEGGVDLVPGPALDAATRRRRGWWRG